jgi:hypothetical protein
VLTEPLNTEERAATLPIRIREMLASNSVRATACSRVFASQLRHESFISKSNKSFRNTNSIWRHIGPPLWSSGQSSLPQIQRSGFHSLRYQIFWQVVGLERDALSLVSTLEELLWRNSSGAGLESRRYGHGDPSRSPRDTLYHQKLALVSTTEELLGRNSSGSGLENRAYGRRDSSRWPRGTVV